MPEHKQSATKLQVAGCRLQVDRARWNPTCNFQPATCNRLDFGLAHALTAALIIAAFTPAARGQSSVTLAWDPSPGSAIAGYRLYQGAASRTYTNVIAAGNRTNATVSNLVSGATCYFAVTAVGTNALESDYSSEISYTVPSVAAARPPSGLTFAADSGAISTPFVATAGTLSQSVTTGVTTGGRAAYTFNIVNAGNYLVSAMVSAPNDGQNSFYVNMDAEPTDPLMIRDIPVSTGLASQTVSWRGNGTADPASAQYRPKVFTLSAGTHQLIIRGREANTTLGAITIAALPPRLKISISSSGTGKVAALVLPAPSPVVLSATGQPGQTYNVLASQDLKTWTLIGILTLDATGSGQFTDPAGNSRPTCMYYLKGQ